MKKQDFTRADALHRRSSRTVTGRQRLEQRHRAASLQMDGAAARENGEYRPASYNCSVADINKKGNTRNLALYLRTSWSRNTSGSCRPCRKPIPEEIRKNDLSRQKARTLVENQYGKNI
jgi:hypothetical protein